MAPEALSSPDKRFCLLYFSLLAHTFWPPVEQECSFTLGGRDLGTHPLLPGWNPFFILLDRYSARQGQAGLAGPAEPPGQTSLFTLACGHRTLNSTGSDLQETLLGELRVRAVNELKVESAGWWCGRRASIRINGQEHCPDRDGLNLVAILPCSPGGRTGMGEDGPIIRTVNFDTGKRWDTGEEMAAFVDGLPRETIILVAARGDASTWFSPSAMETLKSIGGTVDLSTESQPSYVLVGMKTVISGLPRPELASALAPCRLDLTMPPAAEPPPESDDRCLFLAPDSVQLVSIQH